MFDRGRFTVVAIVLQVIFIILFAVTVRYHNDALPMDRQIPHHKNESSHMDDTTVSNDDHNAKSRSEVATYYPFFQDVHVMIYIGFGFLMTFLKRYGFGSVALTLLVSAFVVQWAILTGGWIMHFDHGYIELDMTTLINAEFAAAAVLISFGAVLGKVNALQLLVMAIIEVVLFQANEWIVFKLCKATDVGDSMVVHAFGAYFGIAVARAVFKSDVHRAEEKETSVYHSDIFAMIGTVFLWLFWPSFNSATAVGDGHYRAVVNTYLSLTSCAVTAFAISAIVNKEKFNMIHIQNATLAGGVAVGTMADLIIQPWGALLIGTIAGVISVLGYQFVTPFLSHKLNLHDTCGVHNLHGMPGVLSGIGGIICAAMASAELYGASLTDHFPERGPGQRSAGEQALYQAAGLAASVVIAIAGGLITGLLLRVDIWKQPRGAEIFDDTPYWTLPTSGFPGEEHEQERENHSHSGDMKLAIKA